MVGRGMGTVLLAVLVLGSLSGCNTPTVRADPPSVGKYTVTVRVDPPNVQRGQKATFNYVFANRNNGKPALTLPLVYGATVHTTLVNHDMTWFRTGQAAGPVGGAYPVNVQFGDASSYRLYAEFTSAYTPTERLLYTHTLSFGQGVPSLEQPAPLVESSDREVDFYGVAVKLDTGGPIQVGRPMQFHYTLTAGGHPVTDLNAYDDAAGHLFVISADGEDFAHLIAREATNGAGNAQREPTEGGSSGSLGGNPASLGQPGQAAGPPTLPAGTGTPAATSGPTAPATTSAAGPPPLGPDLTFDHTFEKPGLYKAWLQFLYHGQVVTADYVVRVGP